MKKTMRFVLLMIIAGMVFALPAQADLGLQGVFSDQGAPGVGQTLMNFAQQLFAGSDDPEAVRSQLIEALNEAAGLGDENAARYAVIAVMQAGGAERLDLTMSAIQASRLSDDFPALTEATASETQALLTAGGGSADQQGGGEQQQGGGEQQQQQQGGGEEQQGGGEEELGGGEEPLFLNEIDPGTPFGGGVDAPGGGDDDLPATRV